LVWKAIALHTSPGIPLRLENEIALVHLGAGLDLLGLGLDQVPPQLIEKILKNYPRLGFKAEFRSLLIEHCLNNPAAQVLTWTDDVARSAGCTLHDRPIPTASQIMLAASFMSNRAGDMQLAREERPISINSAALSCSYRLHSSCASKGL